MVRQARDLHAMIRRPVSPLPKRAESHMNHTLVRWSKTARRAEIWSHHCCPPAAFNIESLSVGPHRRTGRVAVTIVIDSDQTIAERVTAYPLPPW